MKIIDTHQHLWDLDLLPYSWTVDNPRLACSFRMSDYLKATQGLEVTKSVHVEADVDEAFMLDETRYILKLSEQPDNPLSGVVAAARPEYDDFRAYLEKIAGHPNLKGIRRILQSMPDETATTTTFIENVRSLAEFGLSFDICVLARQLPQAVSLVERCPEVSFILDHCGNPDIKSGDYRDWKEYLRVISGFPNIACKVSGIVVNTDMENWTEDDLRPAVEHVIESFGWDRVIFGSDWPVCTLAAQLKEWVDALLQITSQFKEEDRQKLFYQNAVNIYRLD